MRVCVCVCVCVCVREREREGDRDIPLSMLLCTGRPTAETECVWCVCVCVCVCVWERETETETEIYPCLCCCLQAGPTAETQWAGRCAVTTQVRQTSPGTGVTDPDRWQCRSLGHGQVSQICCYGNLGCCVWLPFRFALLLINMSSM